MKYKDLLEGACPNQCPVYQAELCPGGVTSYGNGPIEPPCCYFDEDTDIEEWVAETLESQRKYEKAEERRTQKEEEKKAKNKIAQQRRKETQWATREETTKIKQLKKQVQANIRLFELAQSMAEAFNFANEMFGYEERRKVSKEKLELQNKPLLEKIEELEKIKKEKIKELNRGRK